MFTVYIIYSANSDRFYVGYTSDLVKRIHEHNSGMNTSTANSHDWVVQFSRKFENRIQAVEFENFIKKKKSRKYIQWLISSQTE